MIAHQGRSLDQFWFYIFSCKRESSCWGHCEHHCPGGWSSEVRWLIKGYQRVQQWEREFEWYLKNFPSPCRKSIQHRFLLAFVSQGAKVFREPALFPSQQKLLFLKRSLGWPDFPEKASLKKNILVSQGRCYFVGSSLADSTSSYREKRQQCSPRNQTLKECPQSFFMIVHHYQINFSTLRGPFQSALVVLSELWSMAHHLLLFLFLLTQWWGPPADSLLARPSPGFLPLKSGWFPVTAVAVMSG